MWVQINYLKITMEEIWALEKRLELMEERIVQQETVKLVYVPPKPPLLVLQGVCALSCLLLHWEHYCAFVLFSSIF